MRVTYIVDRSVEHLVYFRPPTPLRIWHSQQRFCKRGAMQCITAAESTLEQR